MPKMKTKTAAKKRFKVSANGKVSHRHTHRSHNMGKKTRKRKRDMRQEQWLSDSDVPQIKAMLGTYFTRAR